MDLDKMMNSFRLAGRELFNHFFRLDDPWDRASDAWLLEKRFSTVEEVLFQKLVTEPAALANVRYGDLQSDIVAELRSDFAPIMLNRNVDSGYWDHPIREVTREARLLFVCFFDWDQLGYRDNRYARIKVHDWRSHPETVGKHGLIETHYVRFLKV